MGISQLTARRQGPTLAQYEHTTAVGQGNYFQSNSSFDCLHKIAFSPYGQ